MDVTKIVLGVVAFCFIVSGVIVNLYLMRKRKLSS